LRLLYIIPYTPTLIRTRPYNLIRAMARRGHQITLATLWESESELRELEFWRAEGLRVLAQPLTKSRKLFNLGRGLLSRDPLQSWYCWQPRLCQQITSALRAVPFDLIHIEHLRGARYGFCLQLAAGNLPLVFDSVDCISHLFEQAAGQGQGLFGRWATRLDLGRTRRFEGWLVKQFPQVLVTSPIDRQALEKLSAPQSPTGQRPPSIAVLPNGVDLAYFHPNPAAECDSSTLVVSGKMSYHANVSMILHLGREIMPRVWKHQAEVKLVIVGKDPGPEIQALAADRRITVTGTVADIRPYLWSASVAVAPVRYGAGIQNKVLEALACSVPVIASRQAVSALQAQTGQELLVADDVDTFARSVLHVLSDQATRRQLGQAGRRYVERYHDWDGIAAQLEGIYHGLTRAHKNTG
jgi:glycosyltransferase involved in cell wall biosynthesis